MQLRFLACSSAEPPVVLPASAASACGLCGGAPVLSYVSWNMICFTKVNAKVFTKEQQQKLLL